MKFLLVALVIIHAVALLKDGRVHSASLLRYPFFWVVVFSVFYLILPAIFLDEISAEYGWSLSRDSMFTARLASAYWGVVFLLFYFVFKREICPISNYATPGRGEYAAATGLTILLIIWLAWVAVTQGGTVLDATIAEGYAGDVALGADNKIKNIALLLIPLTCLLTIRGRYALWVCGTILIVFIDAAQGARTTAFIVLAASYIALAISKKRLFAIVIAVFGSAIYSIGIFLRPEELLRIDSVPLHLSLLGEFRETYIPFPFALTYHVKFNVEAKDMFVGLLYPLSGPFRSMLDSLFVNPGELIATAIGRGYGFGLNPLYESYYYGGYIGVLLGPWLICAASYACVKPMKRETWAGLTFVTLFAVFSRLTFREGLTTNSGLFVYWALILIVAPFLLKKFLDASVRVSEAK
jgi:hypothetical protein